VVIASLGFHHRDDNHKALTGMTLETDAVIIAEMLSNHSSVKGTLRNFHISFSQIAFAYILFSQLAFATFKIFIGVIAKLLGNVAIY
jgi:hypothetical protein